jgi:hypothetical protein
MTGGFFDGNEYESVLSAMATYARQSEVESNFCRICWGPLDDCPTHVGYMEMFGPPPTDEEMAAYRADLEVRARGLERKRQALDDGARQLGYDGIDDLVAKTMPC